jgi:hypothetical protein
MQASDVPKPARAEAGDTTADAAITKSDRTTPVDQRLAGRNLWTLADLASQEAVPSLADKAAFLPGARARNLPDA